MQIYSSFSLLRIVLSWSRSPYVTGTASSFGSGFRSGFSSGSVEPVSRLDESYGDLLSMYIAKPIAATPAPIARIFLF